jgi:hypothetical protein
MFGLDSKRFKRQGGAGGYHGHEWRSDAGQESMSLHLELATTMVSTHFPLSGFFTGGSAFMIS